MEAADGRELFWAIELCQRVRASERLIVISDVRMPVYNGLDVLEAWKYERWPGSLVVMTGFPDETVTRRTLELGASSREPDDEWDPCNAWRRAAPCSRP